MPMAVQFTCLMCEEEFRKPDHSCKSGRFCRSSIHFDICLLCQKAMLESFEEQFATKAEAEEAPKVDWLGNRPRMKGRSNKSG
ncbi:MAG: hypothetical protein UY54_C0028G0002 [Parcubacteria group bacterium GW2011_GWA2_50_10b]|nr:MAG: hypothetical protein UY54_C0028G0002 [Parcubacteria group bacterium GW2011_GWA2_50_10b]